MTHGGSAVRRMIFPGVLAALTALSLAVNRMVEAGTGADQAPPAAPAFTGTSPEQWINSEPLRWEDLRGSVVLLDIWTFECWNCYRSFPWMNDLAKRLEDEDFRVIGIHSPEFEREKDRDAVIAKMKEFGLHHPVMLDNDFAYWKALGNRYWPAFYLIDRKGRLRGLYVGETHAGDRRARAIESQIEKLLAEPL